MRANGEVLPFYYFKVSYFNLCSLLHYRWRKISVRICASLRFLPFCICFRSLLINTRLVFISAFGFWLNDTRVVFISYFVSVPLRRVYRGSGISVFLCSFVPVSFCIFDYLYYVFGFRILLFLHFWLFVFKPLVFVGCFVTCV